MVVVADLVARLRREGVEETTRALAAADQQAKATGEALDQLARKFAATQGGTASGWREILEKQGLSAAQVAQHLGEATANASRLSAAAQQVTTTLSAAKASAENVGAALRAAGLQGTAGQVQSVLAAQQQADRRGGLAQALEAAGVSANVAKQQARGLTEETQAAAKAATQVEQGFSLSGASVGRFAAGVVGLGVGLSLATSLASHIHDAVGGIVDRQLEWERSLRLVSGLYGQIGPQVLETARAQAALPGGLGTETENVQAALNARFLSSRYGLPQSRISDLVSAGVRTAGFLGMTEQADREALQARLLEGVEGGGNALRNLGIELSPEMVARQLGYAGPAALQGLTPQQLMQARSLIITSGTNRLAATSTSPDSLLSRRTALERGIEQMQDNIRRGLGPGAEPSAYEAMGPELTGAFPGTPYAAGQPGAIPAQREQLVAMQAKLQELTQSLGTAAEAADQDEAALRKFGLEAGTAAVRLLTFTGSIEDAYSIAHGDIGAQAQAAVTSRMRSALPTYAMPSQEINALARGGVANQAWQNYVAELAQQESSNAVREQLEQIIKFGPGAQRPAAGRALDYLNRGEQIAPAVGEAQKASAIAQLRVAESQSDLDELSLRQRERELDVTERTLGLRRQDLSISRENLGLTEQVIRAQQQAQGPISALQDLQYGDELTGAVARQRQARLMRGQDVSDLPTFDELIRQHVSSALDIAEATPGALRAGQGVTVAGRAATAGALRGQLVGTQLTREQIDAMLAQLADEPSRIAASRRLLGAEGGALAAGRAERGATAALANVSVTIGADGTIRLADDAIKAAGDEARDKVIEILRQGMHESSQEEPPAPPDLPGARR